MKRESAWLWRVAVVAFLAAVSVSAVEAASGASDVPGGSSFTFSQVAVLVAVGAAWGDNRANQRRDSERLDKIEAKVDKFLEGGK